MSYSTSDRRHPNLTTTYATTAAPPPTPSTQPPQISNSEEATEALLSRLLHRLPPSLSLSLPSRLRPSSSTSSATTTIASPPSISLAETPSSLHANILSATKLGFFQLTNHPITSELANNAEAESSLLFNFSQDKKNQLFPQNWPLGYHANNDDDDDEDDEGDERGESLVLDSNSSYESTGLDFLHLKEFTKKMEKLGLEVVEVLASATGFENPVKSDPSQVSSQMWISNTSNICNGNGHEGYSGRVYPYVVGLHYQMRCQSYSILTESGRVSISAPVDSILVTLGDIAQVWSNGKFRKVMGRPTPIIAEDNINNIAGSQCITMSLLITLPVDSMVSPLGPSKLNNYESTGTSRKSQEEDEEENWVFNAFHFEDYAWRIYHERIRNNDPLVRYRV